MCTKQTRIRLGICPVWSESSLCAQWVAKDPRFLHVASEDSDQIGRMSCSSSFNTFYWSNSTVLSNGGVDPALLQQGVKFRDRFNLASYWKKTYFSGYFFRTKLFCDKWQFNRTTRTPSRSSTELLILYHQYPKTDCESSKFTRKYLHDK